MNNGMAYGQWGGLWTMGCPMDNGVAYGQWGGLWTMGWPMDNGVASGQWGGLWTMGWPMENGVAYGQWGGLWTMGWPMDNGVGYGQWGGLWTMGWPMDNGVAYEQWGGLWTMGWPMNNGAMKWCLRTLGGCLDENSYSYTLEVSFFSYITNVGTASVAQPYTEEGCIFSLSYSTTTWGKLILWLHGDNALSLPQLLNCPYH
ncbi:hypothetical protein NP493_500g02013 [Ridgeia piscesae]|uniref:Uncharacterized protein n=1 Tax=Ridgeia piscesae TaxID=27915 RepID=A0AAD9KX32_RIDPI|nr:hypothetical protein NP493_500g02013 [Ridgeia piscesae]